MRWSRPVFVRLPSVWIEAKGLKAFKWGPRGGAETAALLALIALAHHADQETGAIRATYDTLCAATGLSRATLSAALAILDARGIVVRDPALGQSGFRLVGFDPAEGWAKIPLRYLYNGDVMPIFADFKLRSTGELNALKLYLLFAARRDRHTNQALVTYDQIEAYAGVDRPRIRTALSVLTSQGLVHVERLPSLYGERMVNAYRLAHVDSYIHAGTRGRSDEAPADVPSRARAPRGDGGGETPPRLPDWAE